MTGIEFENLVESLLIKNKIPYIREGVKVARGHQTSKGKFDFDTTYAMELKHIDKLSNLTLPCCVINHKLFIKADPKIKSHQLKALREADKVGGLLIHEGSTNSTYWLNMNDLDRLVIEHGLFSTFAYGILDGYEINLDEFIATMK